MTIHLNGLEEYYFSDGTISFFGEKIQEFFSKNLSLQRHERVNAE
jgi:hypothetical protein